MRDFLSRGAKPTKRPHSPRLLSQNSSSASLLNPSTSNFGESVYDLATGSDEELFSDHKKIVQYLCQIDKNVAREFSELSDKIQYDVSYFFITNLPLILKAFIIKGKKK